jgi:exopolyphosphatase/guanosine-5'-triphosphate,3'-diphosphate pyrophosphatase
VRVAVIDIGSNTARLLVADVGADGHVRRIGTRRAYLGLGEEIAARGALGPEAIARAAALAGAYADRARAQGARALRTVVTAPGRQGPTAGALRRALERSTGAPVQLLTASEEGRLAFAGVVQAAERPLPELVAVVDVGGGSTELTVATPHMTATWVHSVDLGSLHLTRRCLHGDPPTRRELREARSHVRRELGEHLGPRPERAFATGGSARAAARIAGPLLDAGALEEVVRVASRRPAREVARAHSLHPHRARTLLAGALLLAETSRSLALPLEVSAAGMREGAAQRLALPPAVAAAA